VVSSPNLGDAENYLVSIAVLSANDSWAVGSYNNDASIDQTLIEHWNGTSWSVVPSPNVGTNYNQLQGVAAVSANDVWAVGGYFTSDGIYQTLIEHWDGTSWSVILSANPGEGADAFAGVAVVSANDVWAVGFYEDNVGPSQTLIEHWNGTSWSVVGSPMWARVVMSSVE